MSSDVVKAKAYDEKQKSSAPLSWRQLLANKGGDLPHHYGEKMGRLLSPKSAGRMPSSSPFSPPVAFVMESFTLSSLHSYPLRWVDCWNSFNEKHYVLYWWSGTWEGYLCHSDRIHLLHVCSQPVHLLSGGWQMDPQADGKVFLRRGNLPHLHLHDGICLVALLL